MSITDLIEDPIDRGVISTQEKPTIIVAGIGNINADEGIKFTDHST